MVRNHFMEHLHAQAWKMADAQSFFERIDVTCRNLPSRTFIINEILILINFQYVSINLKEPAEKLN